MGNEQFYWDGLRVQSIQKNHKSLTVIFCKQFITHPGGSRVEVSTPVFYCRGLMRMRHEVPEIKMKVDLTLK